MESNERFRVLVDQIIDPASDTANVLSQLEILSNADGLLLAELSTLIGLIFEPMVSSMVRNRLLTKCLIPRSDYVIPPDVILRVLGSIGAPEIYYLNGKQHKLKRFSLPTQQKILQWTISALPFFGKELYRVLRRSLPILFGLLSYEFLRPYISTLIIVATVKKPNQSISDSLGREENIVTYNSLRAWHVNLVIDLLDRFPLDASLKALVLHFSRSDILPDLQHLLRQNQFPSTTLSTGGIALPDNKFPAILRLKEKRNGEFTEEILQIHQTLSRVYKDFERTTKKRRIEPGFILKQEFFNTGHSAHQVPISSINSVSSLVKNFENISFINPSSVLSKMSSPNHRFRCLYVSLVLLNANASNLMYKKLSTALRHNVFSDNSLLGVFRNFLIEQFARYGTLFAFKADIENFMERSLHEKETMFLNRQLSFLPYFHLAQSQIMLPLLSKIFTSINELLKEGRPTIQNVIPQIMSSLSLLIRKIDNLSVVDEVLETVIPKLFQIMEDFWSALDISKQLSFLLFLNAALELATDKLSTWNNPGCMIPPPPLMFKLVVSTNPLIVSEALGLIASIKKLKLSEKDSFKLALKNAYVMDSINFLWREMAFKYEKGTINKGMYLHPHYLQRLSGLDFFSDSSLILTRSVGGIVHNPAFAYLCAEIVWRLEDMDPSITTRHPGPISEVTIANLQQDNDVTWLRIGYQELRLSLLNQLDAMGFHGLADLLFTSLKPLVNQRTRTDVMS